MLILPSIQWALDIILPSPHYLLRMGYVTYIVWQEGKVFSTTEWPARVAA